MKPMRNPGSFQLGRISLPSSGQLKGSVNKVQDYLSNNNPFTGPRPTLGPECNGDPIYAFPGIGWTFQAGTAIPGPGPGAVYTAATGNASAFRTSAISLVAGRTYFVEYTIDTMSEGSLSAFVGSTPSTLPRTSPGTYAEVLTAGAGQILALRASTAGSTTCTISFFSVREILTP